MYLKKSKITFWGVLALTFILFPGLTEGAKEQKSEENLILDTANTQEQKPKVNLTLSVEKEVKIFKDGEWVVERVPVENSQNVSNGDILAYTVAYLNEGKGEARDFAIVDSIPDGTVYLSGSAQGDETEITYSIDGGILYQEPPVKYVFRKADGTEEERIASPDMYTHIKWVVKKLIPSGQGGQVSFKTNVK